MNTNEWTAYYKKFKYFSHEKVREDCHPRIKEHPSPVENAVVLVHGLTDSPYFMTAIADHFYDNLGYNVYLPLLHYHGLKEPEGMEGVDLKEWKKNVKFAINAATLNAKRVSIGGLSTGGTLSFYMACTNPQVNGELYLFSTALDLNVGPKGILGNLTEIMLRTNIITGILDWKDEDKPLIGKNPYRYDRIDIDGAQELSMLIKETDNLFKKYNDKNPFEKRVFAAHSKCDATADIKQIYELQKITPLDRFYLYELPEEDNVSHASLVLKDPIYAKNSAENELPLEEANPKFDEMMEAICLFV